jgi:hypothetical protein
LGDHQQLLEGLRTQTLQVTERACLIHRASLFFLAAVGVLIVCTRTLVAGWFFPLGGFLSALMGLRESLEQVELEGRFVFHAVEPSLSNSRQDTEEIFTDTSS